MYLIKSTQYFNVCASGLFIVILILKNLSNDYYRKSTRQKTMRHEAPSHNRHSHTLQNCGPGP